MVSQMENGWVGILAVEYLLLNPIAILAFHDLTKAYRD